MVELFMSLYNTYPYLGWRVNPNPDRTAKPPTLYMDARDITLATQSSVAGPYITAHDLSEYRWHKFSLLMLPDVKLPVDSLLRKEVFENVQLSLQG